jgi:hypothetical protein
MNRVSSAPISAGGHSAGWSATSSSYQTSRPSCHVDLAAGAPDHHHVGDRLELVVLECPVHVGLEGHLAAAPQALVGGDDQLGVAVLDAAGDRLGREAAEHDGMWGADPGAGQHRHRGLRDHGHVDRDHVALADTKRPQAIGELADLLVELPVADALRFRGIVALPDDGRLVAALREMAVEAVGAGIERAVLEPADMEVAAVEGDVLDLGVGPDPVDALAVLSPEFLRVGDGRCVHFLVLVLVAVCGAGKVGRHRIDLGSGHGFLLKWPRTGSRRRGLRFCFRESCFRLVVSTLDLRRTGGESRLAGRLGRAGAPSRRRIGGVFSPGRCFFATQHFCNISVFPDKCRV